MERTEAPAGTHVGLGPVDEDLAHHPEQFLGVGVGFCQPLRPGVSEGTGEGAGSPGRGHPESLERAGNQTPSRDGIFYWNPAILINIQYFID